MPNVFNKEKYVINYENSQLYLRLGSKIKKQIAYYNLINLNGKNNMLNSTHRKE